MLFVKNTTNSNNLDISVYLDNTQLSIVNGSSATLSGVNTGLGGLSTVKIGGIGSNKFIGQMKDLYVFNYPFSSIEFAPNNKYSTSDNGFGADRVLKPNIFAGKQVLDLRNKYLLSI